ncbi:MAG: HD domain-containing protein, partial [Gammaproteobacteria bacterium]|nr:HD domain-containing protein [Gammaproteobacteria bacterium]
MECIDAADRQRVAALLSRHTPEHGKALSLAIETACHAHHDQLRKSGEPYYLHALAVAEILDELKLDYETLVAAVLHDVVEDTSTTLGQVGDDFGPTIARMVDGVTKMERIGEFRQQESVLHKDAEQAESLRKLLLAMAEDVRVVLIKLADRLHNMRTLRHLDRDRQRRIAQETLDIYAPLANRLGIWQIKWELEDLSLRYLEPEAYQEIARQLAEKRTNRESYISRVIGILEEELAKAGIDTTITGRSKHIYSIWRKMQRKQLGFEQ